jgi:hypothetical protein
MPDSEATGLRFGLLSALNPRMRDQFKVELLRDGYHRGYTVCKKYGCIPAYPKSAQRGSQPPHGNMDPWPD